MRILDKIQLVEAWARGWALSRGVRAPEPFAGGQRIYVGECDHIERFIFPSLDAAALSNLTGQITSSGVFLKVICAPEALLEAVDTRWRLQPAGDLMAVDLSIVPAAMPLPSEYSLGFRSEGAVLFVEVSDTTGELAASGRAALTGRFAVFDKIITEAAHQRRGLGRFVMGFLAERAREQGSERGVLVATTEGRALYTALGWCLGGRLETVVILPCSAIQMPTR